MARVINPNRDTAKLGQLRQLLAQAKVPFIWVGVFSFAANILMLALPVYSLQVMDRVMSSYNMNTLIMLSILTVGCFVFYSIFTALRASVLNYVGEWLQFVLSPKLMGLAVENSAIGVPASASQFQRELGNIKNFITGAGVTTLCDAPFSIIFILVIYMINPILGFMTLVGAVMLLAFGVIVEFSTKKPLNRSNELNLRSMQFAEAASRNAEAVEAMGMLSTLIHKWHNQNKEISQIMEVANGRSNLLMSLSRFLRMILQIAITGVGAYLSLQGQVTMGNVIAASIISGRALAPFEAAIGLWKQWVGARDSYDRVESALSDIPRMRGTMAMPAPGGKLKVEGLIYTPPRSTFPILRGIQFELNAHESLGLIGPSAAGKSTLARLLMGILPPTHGHVRLDSVDIFHWNRQDLGKYVGYLPQDVELFPGTIRDNIARMSPEGNDEKVIEAAQFAGCHEMILRLPKGYETEFSPSMMSLSPGQRQRIGLARALYNKPTFVVLDEPNSNLDGEGEIALQQSILRMKQAGITFVLVAHKPSIVTHVDKILMLQDGMMKEFGPRETVLQKYMKSSTQMASATPPEAKGA
jgi:PrtD family type I secretion system ABC transporter